MGGDKILALGLMDKINALEQSKVIKDIILMPTARFHSLKGNQEGYFAIDVKGPKQPWRIILRPLNENRQPYITCHIDEIAAYVEIVEIREVSKHYE